MERLHDLSDVTFIIPFCLDSPARLRNVRLVVESLVRHFTTTVVVSEYDAISRLQLDHWPAPLRGRLCHQYFHNPEPYFQRTRSANLVARAVQTPYLAIYDADVLVETEQLLQAVAWLRDGRCRMSLPFANRVIWIPRDDVPALGSCPTDAELAALPYPTSDDTQIFVGLVGLLNTRAFLKAGLMNEHFRAWGYEEMELYIRLLKLGYRILRTGGRAYHLGHGNAGHSGPDHPEFLNNQREYHRILALNPDELRREIASWPWLPRVGHTRAAA
jgi:hypothetical protein